MKRHQSTEEMQSKRQRIEKRSLKDSNISEYRYQALSQNKKARKLTDDVILGQFVSLKAQCTEVSEKLQIFCENCLNVFKDFDSRLQNLEQKMMEIHRSVSHTNICRVDYSRINY
jgi:uncharacterized protein with HEPN domain